VAGPSKILQVHRIALYVRCLFFIDTTVRTPKPRLMSCVNARLWPHADMRTWAPSFWSQRILRILSWGPSGTTARLQDSHDLIWSTKGLSYLRPRCIEAERPRTHVQSIYLSIYLRTPNPMFPNKDSTENFRIYKTFQIPQKISNVLQNIVEIFI